MALPRQWWYPACRSGGLRGRRPHGITLLGEPIVLFRDASGTAHALVDRCPHRNVPLSMGRVHDDGCLECGYHGWRFDGEGHCAEVPGLGDALGDERADGERAGSGRAAVRDVAAYEVTEADGFVWVWGDPTTPAHRAPFALPAIEGRPATIGEVVFTYDLDATLHAALENHLDVPHTAFLHRGIFRGGEPNELTAVRRQIDDPAAHRHGIEVQYLGEPVGLGNLRVGARSGAEPVVFDHWDRFFVPGIAQIEYRVKDLLTIVNTILHLPLTATRTRAWFVVRYRTPLPAGVAKPIVLGRGWQIARQDVAMLAAQTGNVVRFGGERYTSTDLDLMGAGIWRMLRQAERAEHPGRDDGPPDGPPDGSHDGSPRGNGRAGSPPTSAGVEERRVTFRA